MKKLSKIVISFVMALSFIVFSGCSMEQGETGEQLVLKKFGEIQDETVGKGLQIKIGFGYEYVVMITRTKQLNMSGNGGKDTQDVINDKAVTILTDKNLQVPIELSVIYNLKPEYAKNMLGEVGRDIIWDNKIMVPKVNSVTREVIGKADIYILNSKRSDYEKGIKTMLSDEVKSYGIDIISVEIRDIILPERIRESVLSKEVAKEDAKRAVYLTSKIKEEAKQEIERQRGIASANKILVESITDKLIKFKQIEVGLKRIDKWNGILPTNLTIMDKNSDVSILVNGNK